MIKYKWRIVALLFFATTINYIDRNVLSFTMIDEGFQKEMLGIDTSNLLTEEDHKIFKEKMGYVDSAFKGAYALGFLIVGWFIDKVGTKIGFACSIFFWSLAGIAHAFVGSIASLRLARIGLGIGEAGNIPSAVKTVAEWFPKKERAFATGFFNAGANVGVIATAIAVPWITNVYGWRTSFIVTGSLGLLVLIVWLWIYKKPEDHKQLSDEELKYIKSDNEDPDNKIKTPWAKLWPHKQTWSFGLAKFMTDPVWYLYLTWLPDFFNSNEALDDKLNLKSISIPFLIIYLVSDFGSIIFGWLSSQLIKKGWSINKARKTTMFICALCVMPIFFASITHSIIVAIALIALATAAHQGWSTNLYTTVSDMFPKQAVGSVIGIGGMMGAIGGMILAALTGLIRVKYGYFPLFMFASTAYLFALLILHFLVPKLEQVKID